YAVLLVLALASGLPVGFRLFGRRHAAGWIAGAILGYGLASLAAWLGRIVIPESNAAVVVLWLLAITLTGLVFSPRRADQRPWIDLPAWSRGASSWSAVTLCVVPLLVTLPFPRITAHDRGGGQRMHAYFTADFVWHMAIVAELQKGEQPP